MNFYRTIVGATAALSAFTLASCASSESDSAQQTTSQAASANSESTSATSQRPTIANNPDRKLKNERNDAGDIVGKVGKELGYCNKEGQHCNVVFMVTELAPVDADKCASESFQLADGHKFLAVRTEVQGNATTPEQNPILAEGLTKEQFDVFNQDFVSGFQNMHTWTALDGEGVNTPALESAYCPSVAPVGSNWGVQNLRFGSKIRTVDVFQIPENASALYLTSVQNSAARWKFDL